MMKLMNGSLALALYFSDNLRGCHWRQQLRQAAVGLLALSVPVVGAAEYSEPSITRNQGVEAKIDTENFEVGTYLGALSLVDFGVNSVFGVRFGYHLTEDFFFEVAYGTSDASETSFETLNSVQLLSDDERGISLVTANLGWQLMPGETFVTSKITLTSQLFAMVGLGTVDFAGESDTLIDLGVGYRVLASDWLAMRFDFKDHIFKTDVLGNDQQTHNFEASLGISFFF